MSKQAPKWSPDEVEELRYLAGQGLRPSVIARQLGRTVAGVRGKAISCGIPLVGERSRAGVTLRRPQACDLSSPRGLAVPA